MLNFKKGFLRVLRAAYSFAQGFPYYVIAALVVVVIVAFVIAGVLAVSRIKP